jgi:peptidyl-prolyl cis-trans isomerase SurA
VQKNGNLLLLIIITALMALAFSACASSGSPDARDSMVAATVNGKNLMLAEVERTISQQSAGKQSQLSQLELAQARLQVLDSLIQREVLFQRAEREKLLPTEEQITSSINQQKQQSGMTDEDFQKSLAQQNMTMEGLREEARKDVAIKNLQEKYSGKISISDKEVEDFYNNNRQRFVNSRGVALAMIVVDPIDNSGQGIQNDAKSDAEAKVKIDNVYQQLKGGADFATVARAKSEDANSLTRGGDIGFASEDDLKQNGFPPELVARFFGPMQVGDLTEPVRFNSGKWYIFKLEEKRLQTENLTLESPGVRQQITQALVNQRKDILNTALLEVAMYEAKIINNLAGNMLTNPSNLGLRPASPGATAAISSQQSSASPAQTPATTASSPTISPKAVSPK